MAQALGSMCEYFIGRDGNSIKLSKGESRKRAKEFKVLTNFKFSPERKCSSVVVRAPDGEVYVYVKGSEMAIKAMLKDG